MYSTKIPKNITLCHILSILFKYYRRRYIYIYIYEHHLSLCTLWCVPVSFENSKNIFLQAALSLGTPLARQDAAHSNKLFKQSASTNFNKSVVP